MIRSLSKDDDLSLIYSTWAKQINESYLPIKPKTSKYLYVKAQRRAAENLIKTSKTLLYVDPESQSVIHGYLIYEDSLPNEKDSIIDGLKLSDRKVIHFLYVKGAFRKAGIANKLCESAQLDPSKCVFTCWTNESDLLWKKFPGSIYVPLGVFDR
jgi:hypothetical protein